VTARIPVFPRGRSSSRSRIVDLHFPNRFSTGGHDDYLPAPLKGGYSVAILREIGYDHGAIDGMVRSKATIDGRRRQSEE
jgi:hypothetical protein